MTTIFLFLSILFSMFFYSCKEEDKPIMCTEEFRTVGINVNGDSLTNYYTIRPFNNDTILPTNSFQGVYENYYVVLDDSYRANIANKQETFIFIGFINDSIVVNEEFIIKADDCHIEKVSGKETVNL